MSTNTTSQPAITFQEANEVFARAISAGHLSINPNSPVYVGNYMYMGTKDADTANECIMFKHTDTRSYLNWLTCKPNAGNTWQVITSPDGKEYLCFINGQYFWSKTDTFAKQFIDEFSANLFVSSEHVLPAVANLIHDFSFVRIKPVQQAKG